MGCMKSVVQCVGVIINTSVLSVYRVWGGMCFNVNMCSAECIGFCCFVVHVIALCTLHVAFLGNHTIHETQTHVVSLHMLFTVQPPHKHVAGMNVSVSIRGLNLNVYVWHEHQRRIVALK